MNTRTFTLADQIAFAELTGDCNPLHVDPLAARRTLFGRPVVHGLHAAMWAVERWLAQHPTGPLKVQRLKTAFLKPIYLDTPVTWAADAESACTLTMSVMSDGELATRSEIAWDSAEPSAMSPFSTSNPPRVDPQPLSLDAVAGRSGSLAISFNRDAAAALFPHLTARVPPLQLATLLSTTRVVGMECPGLHSVFFELDLAAAAASDDAVVTYAVTKVDRRFRLASITIAAPGMTGTIKAFVRPEPAEQLPYAALQPLVGANEFGEQRAVIVGGSRGLGEVAAKLLSAGGADVRITYNTGREDAFRVRDDIVSHGGRAEVFHFDVLKPDPPALAAGLGRFHPTDIYYFATPFIAAGSKTEFSSRLFDMFCDFYVSGFERSVALFTAFGVTRYFYPSTVFLDNAPGGMAEYAAAKAAGEAMCATLETADHALRIFRPRLPRMTTDQTASTLPVTNEDPAPVMLRQLRAFRDDDKR